MGAERAPDGPRGVPPFDPSPDPHARLRAFLRWGLAALIFLAPLPFGSVEPPAVLALELAAAVLGAAGLSVLVSERPAFPRPVKIAMGAAAGIAVLMVLQAVPMPAGVVRVLVPPVAEAREAVGAVLPELKMTWFPLSLSPADTWDALARFTAYGLIGIATIAAVRGSRDLLFLGMAFAASGLFQAVYGTAEFLSGRQQIFGYVKKYYLDSATGTFINRNHYASMLAMCAPFALGCAAGWNALHPNRPRAQHVLVTAAGALAAATMLGAVALSGSRGGSAAALVGVAAFLLMTGRSWRRLVAAGVLVALPVGYLLWQDVRSPLDRLEQLEVDVGSPGGRVAAWRAAAALVPESPVFGWGTGGFEEAFAAFSESRSRARYDHLHNEPLQHLFEGGLPVLALGALMLVIFPLAATRTAVRGSSRARAVAAATAALVATALHGTVDFAPRIPAIAVLVGMALAGLAGAALRMPHGAEG